MRIRNDAWKAEFGQLMQTCKDGVAEVREVLVAARAKWEELKPYLRETDTMSVEERADIEQRNDTWVNTLQQTNNSMGTALHGLDNTMRIDTSNNSDQELLSLRTALLDALKPLATVVKKLKSDAWRFNTSMNALRIQLFPEDVEFAAVGRVQNVYGTRA
jgi:hypothetical protein